MTAGSFFTTTTIPSYLSLRSHSPLVWPSASMSTMCISNADCWPSRAGRQSCGRRTASRRCSIPSSLSSPQRSSACKQASSTPKLSQRWSFKRTYDVITSDDAARVDRHHHSNQAPSTPSSRRANRRW
ncbi:hypothetical protein IE81DRAFT_258669 [Ceraceosorus guamensis]|uniref:Uncharacterized protein n=1 Tax=Ceraceosorus guamensis TaxID=1522189 RepID=A0A316VQ51_9BASI|nr:hypothetical protein IE81DRAFT_258669 [Ceraceosorus guamensis]PWN39769.1 hypothetical protein IE81DRAFT_258669 [Ceraceosorus guamensis]